MQSNTIVQAMIFDISLKAGLIKIDTIESKDDPNYVVHKLKVNVCGCWIKLLTFEEERQQNFDH